MPNLFDALPPDVEPLRASSDLVFHRLFLGRNHLLGPKLVKRFLFREETSGEVLSSRLAVHAVEMVRFAELAPEHEAMRTRLGLWIRFFLARGRATLEAIAAESAIMSDATKALVDLSRERDLQQTMADREYMVLWREAYDARKARDAAETLAAALAAADEAKAALAAAEAMNASAKEAAAAVARDEALSERLARARASLRLLFRVKFGSIGDAQEKALANATLHELDALTARVEQAPTLEAVFAGP